MTQLFLAHGEQASFGTYGTDWLYLLIPVGVLVAVIVGLIVRGKGDGQSGLLRPLFVRAGDSLERITGLPAWTAAGIAMGLWALIVAVIGFLWDVAWHMDFGRDEFLFTPAHMMILVGLMSIAASAILSTTFATLSRADTGFRMGPLTVPYGAFALGLLGFGALMGFPLDELWHQNYGIDVTMWGPTHLVMISGASFAPLGLWLLLAEAGPNRGRPALVKSLKYVLAGAVLIGLSTFQAEFDFGVPQFQQLYHPVLIAVATGVGLVAARMALGVGGALHAAVGFLVCRAALALLLGSALNETVPRFPLYLAAAIAVEVVAWFGRDLRPLRIALMAGAAIAVVGIGAEWGWTQMWGRHPWGSSLLPGVWIVVPIAVAAAVLGAAIGRLLTHQEQAIGRGALIAAGAIIVVGLAIPLPRHDADYRATLTTESATDGRVDLEVALDPPTAAADADFFEVLSWQGGSVSSTPLREFEPGRYRSERPVPAAGEWKSFVRIVRKDIMVAVPLYMPRDPEIDAAEIPVRPQVIREFRRDTQLLMREAHAGAAWPAMVAYGAILFLVICWIGSFAFAFAKLGKPQPPRPTDTRAMKLHRPVTT